MTAPMTPRDRRIEALWIDAASRLGLPVARGGPAFVHWDGRTLHLAEEDALDEDDSVAQLVLHEICHLLVQGPACSGVPDWGLDNTSDRDEAAERACLRLQAHLAAAHGLRAALHPTTVARAYYHALPPSPLEGADTASRPAARRGALGARQTPFADVLDAALSRTAELLDLPRHASGFVASADPALRCGDCGFRAASGLCRKAPRRLFVDGAATACTRFEPPADCFECAACCRSAYDAVMVPERAAVALRHPMLVERRDGALRLRRIDDHCAALEGPAGGPWRCTIHDDRPRPCRDFARAGRHCLEARRRVGLSY